MLRLAGEAAALVSGVQGGDVLYVWEPLFHIGGAQMMVLPLIRRATLVIAECFSASRFWSDISASGATHMHFLGGILQMLLKQPPGPLDRAHGVRVAWGGMPQGDLATVRRAVRRHHPRVLRHDGMLELHDRQPRRPCGLSR
jgi:crotonobetaine/carnitine-CoA ligase